MLVVEWSKITVSELHLVQNLFCKGSLGMCLPYRKTYFQPHQWKTFFFRAQITQILLFLGMPVFERSTFSENFFGMKVLGIYLLYVKRSFQKHQRSGFIFRAQITYILLFSRMPVSWRTKIRLWEWHLFQNFFYYGRFRHASILRRKVFSAASAKWFFFTAQISQIQLFWTVPFLERSKITVWEQHLFERYFCYGSFRYLLTLCKKVFSGAPVKCFFLRAQITQILLFSKMPISGRSKITVGWWHLFKNFFCYGNFYVSTLRKKVFSDATVKLFSLWLK